MHAQDDKLARTWKARRRAHSAACGGVGLSESGDPRKGKMHPHLAREATVRDVETTRYGRHYAGRRGKIMHVDKDPQTGAATGYVLSMEDGGNEVRFEPEEIRIIEAWD